MTRDDPPVVSRTSDRRAPLRFPTTLAAASAAWSRRGRNPSRVEATAYPIEQRGEGVALEGSRQAGLTSTEAAREARAAMLTSAAGVVTYFVCIWLARDIFGFPMAYVTPIFGSLFLIDLVLAATAQRWSSSMWKGLAYGCSHVLVHTVLLHFLGGLRMSFLIIIYALTIFRTATIGTDVAVVLTANAGALCYGILALLEVKEWVPLHGNVQWQIEATQAAGFVFMAWAGFNFVGVYAIRYGQQVRHFTSELQNEVAVRTAALTAVNSELASKARALEEKQTEVRTFVYAVTHDLKNPMNAILLTADLLREREGGQLSAEGREDLERIVRLAGGTEDMIRDLLGLFKITSEVEAPAWVDVGTLVAEAVETLRPQIAAKRVRLEVGPLPSVWGQPAKLGNVVSNLLSNAVKYVSQGHGRVEVTGDVTNGHTVLRVRDNGIGIPDAYHAGIFELFGRVPMHEQEVDGRVASGTGVGLAIVKRIVEAHEGTVWVESTPGVGSCFYVRLPSGNKATR